MVPLAAVLPVVPTITEALGLDVAVFVVEVVVPPPEFPLTTFAPLLPPPL